MDLGQLLKLGFFQPFKADEENFQENLFSSQIWTTNYDYKIRTL